MTKFAIGKLSDQTGVNIETIRFYEKIGLMPKPQRSGSGHRRYDSLALKRLAFVKRARQLGFPIEDIRRLLGLHETSPTCAEVYETAAQHRVVIRQKIAELKWLDSRLTTMMSACTRKETPQCALIDVLQNS